MSRPPMHRRSLAAATTAAFLLSFPLASAALAEVSVPRADLRYRDAPEPFEALRLDCAVRPAGPAVGCTWSVPRAGAAAGLRLMRFDPAVDDHRQAVLRTQDTAATTFLDEEVRAGHRYGYVIQALAADGSVVGRSRTEWVAVPADEPGVEVLSLACAAGAGGAVGCEWRAPTGGTATTVTLWRSVDGDARTVVARFRPGGATAYRDEVPAGALQVTYAVVATDAADAVVARSRPEQVRLPGRPTTTTAVTRPVARPVTTTTGVAPSSTTPPVTSTTATRVTPPATSSATSSATSAAIAPTRLTVAPPRPAVDTRAPGR